MEPISTNIHQTTEQTAMYLAMTQQDYQEVINEAPRIVAKRLGLSADQEKAHLLDEISSKDQLAAGLLTKFIDTYTEWWETSCAATQGDANSEEIANTIQLLIDKRGQMRTALLSYLNSQYPAQQ